MWRWLVECVRTVTIIHCLLKLTTYLLINFIIYHCCCATLYYTMRCSLIFHLVSKDNCIMIKLFIPKYRKWNIITITLNNENTMFSVLFSFICNYVFYVQSIRACSISALIILNAEIITTQAFFILWLVLSFWWNFLLLICFPFLYHTKSENGIHLNNNSKSNGHRFFYQFVPVRL